MHTRRTIAGVLHIRIGTIHSAEWASSHDVVDAERRRACRKLPHQSSGDSGKWMGWHGRHTHEQSQYGAHATEIFFYLYTELFLSFHADFEKEAAGERYHDVEVMRNPNQIAAEDIVLQNHGEYGGRRLVCSVGGRNEVHGDWAVLELQEDMMAEIQLRELEVHV